MDVGPLELILILVIVTMLFGVGRLPEVFGAVGKGIRAFRREVDAKDEVKPVQPVDAATVENPQHSES
ncbi:MAG: twin-arginine translocase TatA/TatE family subunit [Caldilineaceae bacterium]